MSTSITKRVGSGCSADQPPRTVTVTPIVTSIVTSLVLAPTTTAGTAPRASTRAPTDNCDPSYPDFCIPPPPPDLDCADINGRNFTVLPPDPHGFDREGDRLGCER